jgi:3-oxoacyl-[acyl-carrier protein] reductase
MTTETSKLSRFAGEVAIVTGGAQGIGLAIADRLSKEGAQVAIFDSNTAAGERAAETLRTDGRGAHFAPCDVTDRKLVCQAVQSTISELGAPTILVNNAGIGLRAPFLDLTDESWNRVLAVNLTGAFIVAQEVCRHMMKGKRGSIVNVASAAAHMAHSEQAAYAASKAGLEALTRVMAFELAPHGIRVNAVSPGTIATDFLRAMLSPEARSAREQRIPIGRLGLDDAAWAVVEPELPPA